VLQPNGSRLAIGVHDCRLASLVRDFGYNVTSRVRERGDEVDLRGWSAARVQMALRSSAASLGKSVRLRRGMGSGIWKGDAAEDGDESGHLGGNVEAAQKASRAPFRSESRVLLVFCCWLEWPISHGSDGLKLVPRK
jgi:hypothetical protein